MHRERALNALLSRTQMSLYYASDKFVSDFFQTNLYVISSEKSISGFFRKIYR